MNENNEIENTEIEILADENQVEKPRQSKPAKTEKTRVVYQSKEELQRDYKPVDVNLETLLEAGAHFGHQAEKWNPKMLPFIYGKKNNVHIINLDLTLDYWKKAKQIVKTYAEQGKSFLFVGTKEQSREIVANAAIRCGEFYINNRWLGGTLTNHETIKRSIKKMNSLEDLLKRSEEPDSKIKINKKEKLYINRFIDKLSANLSGIREMKKAPDVVFVVDIKRDAIAVDEAVRLHIPVIALVDTNTDPRIIRHPIPANDDSKKTIELFANAIADVIILGKASYERSFSQTQGANKGRKNRDTKKSEIVEEQQSTATEADTAVENKETEQVVA